MKKVPAAPRVTVSLATDEDVAFLAREGRDMFARSHREAMKPDDLAVYLEEAFDAERLKRHILRPDNVFLIARADGEPAGYARIMEGPASALVTAPDAIELRRLYVEEVWHGRGVAPVLMSAVLNAAAERRKTACWLHVWERNARAIAFYEKFGFACAGREASPYRASAPIALVMVRELSATD